MNYTADKPFDFTPKNDYFIGIDSDGCVFDTMEIKHKQCFIPEFIHHLNLELVEKVASAKWEFVNLYSRTRGINRYLGLIDTLKLLESDDKTVDILASKNQSLPDINPLLKWVSRTERLGEKSLMDYNRIEKEVLLDKVIDWTKASDRRINKYADNIPPFKGVDSCLDKISGVSDIMVLSSAPIDYLQKEWDRWDLSKYVRRIAGQESGSKKDNIASAASGKYDPEKVLMVGDAPGDLAAAKSNNFLFYPILPGREVESWSRFSSEALDNFLNGSYSGKYEEKLINEFFLLLPEREKI